MAKDRFGYGTEETNQMAEMFKANTSAWLRLTEMPGMFDKRRRDEAMNPEGY